MLASHEPLLAGLVGRAAGEVLPLVAAKLGREPVEDLRVDLEDGYGLRPDAEEDGHVRAAAAGLARSQQDGTAPPSPASASRAWRRPPAPARCAASPAS